MDNTPPQLFDWLTPSRTTNLTQHDTCFSPQRPKMLKKTRILIYAFAEAMHIYLSAHWLTLCF